MTPISVLIGSILSMGLGSIPVAEAAPGIFAYSANGANIGAVEHADGSLISVNAPAKPGETIEVYLTGLGATNPEVQTGQLTHGEPTVITPTASLGGQPAQVAFSGASTYPGLYQVNLVVPNIPAGYAQLLISSAGDSSQPGIMIPIGSSAPSTGPTIVSIQPDSTSAGPAPQMISIVGIGFQTGLAVALTSPGGETQSFTGSQLQNVSSSTFQISAALTTAGTWTVRVTNPGGLSASGSINVVAQAGLDLNFTAWPPVFTVGDPSATIALQISNPAGGFITGTAIATTANGTGWLTVDGHSSDTWAITPSVGTVTSVALTANPSGLQQGTYSGSVTLNAPNATSPNLNISVTMTILLPLMITTTALPIATWGQPYSYQLQASGGNTYTWSLQSGSQSYLPPNLSLSPSGLISGTLVAAGNNGSYPFTAMVTDERGRSQYVNLTLQVQPSISVSTFASSNFQSSSARRTFRPHGATIRSHFRQQVESAPYTWSASGLPQGLSMDAPTGTIIEIPDAGRSIIGNDNSDRFHRAKRQWID